MLNTSFCVPGTGEKMNTSFEAKPGGYKTFFMLNSTEHKISISDKTKMLKKRHLFFKTLGCCIYQANKC